MSLRVNAMPRPEDTTARLHQPDTHYDGSPRHICVVEFEQMSVQFDSPEDALAWLAWCADHVREALRAQGPDYVIARINNPTWAALCAIGGEL